MSLAAPGRLGLALLAPCALALTCSTTTPPTLPPPPLDLLPVTHGVASGDARPTEIVLWSRTAGDGFLNARVEGEGRLFTATARAVAARDYTAKVKITGLEPGSRYEYFLWFEASPSSAPSTPVDAARGRFRTPPLATEARPVTFAWSGDLGGQNVCRDATRGYPIFDHIPGEELDFFLALGDMIYADDPCRATGALGNAQVPLAAGYSSRLRDYWDHWRYNREDPGYARLLSSTSVYSMWDDHEVVNDFGPEEASRGGPPWIRGVSLLPLGRQALLDYNPIAEDPRDPGKLYRSFSWGKHVELLLLDTRQYRDRNSRDDTAQAPKTLLGAEQKAWLSRTLRASRPTWTFVVSSVPLSVPTGHPVLPLRDGWASGDSERGFERELRDVFAELHAAGRRNVLWLTTDVHFAAVYRYVPLPEHRDWVVHEAIVGPLAAGLFPRREFDTTFGTERLFFHGPNAWADVKTWDELLPWLSFGRIDVDAKGALHLAIVDGLGRTIYTQALGDGSAAAAPPGPSEAAAVPFDPLTSPSTCEALLARPRKAAATEHVAWATVHQVSSRGADTSTWQTPTAIALVDSTGKAAWCAPMPKSWGKVRLAPETVAAHHGDPAGVPLARSLIRDDRVWLYASGRVAAYARDTGILRLDHKVPASPDGPLFFDEGRFTITTPAARCEGETRGAEIFAGCGTELVAFSGAGLSVMRLRDASVLGSRPLDHTRHVVARKPGSVTVELSVAGVKLRIDGAIHPP